MSNCYQLVAACIGVPCSPLLYDKLRAAWDTAAEEGMDDSEYEDSGFDIEYSGGEMYMYAEDFGNPDAIPAKVLEVLGEIITNAGLPHLEFGAAYYDDKRRPNSCGGFRFKIHRDGSLEYAQVSWKKGEKQ